MTVEEIKQWILDNKKGLIVGAIAAIVIRSIIR
jgi:predicted negative regulator of RcsB-dependent stress response